MSRDIKEFEEEFGIYKDGRSGKILNPDELKHNNKKQTRRSTNTHAVKAAIRKEEK